MLTTEIVVVLLGLALIGAFVRLVLFTPEEEERPTSYGSLLRESPRPDRYCSRGLRFLHQAHHRKSVAACAIVRLSFAVDCGARIGHTARSWLRSISLCFRLRRFDSCRMLAIERA